MNNMRELPPRGPDTHGETENDQALDLGATVLPVLAKGLLEAGTSAYCSCSGCCGP